MLKKILLVSRPISWVNTAYPFAAGYFISGGTNWWLLATGTAFFLIPYNLLMYGINDVFDYESDIKNPRKGGIEGMKESKALHKPIIYSSVILAVPFLVFLFATSGVLGSLVLALSVFFVLAYSVPVLRFKERALLDSATSSLHFTLPLVYGVVLTSSFAPALTYIFALFLWGMASHAFGAVQDILPDRKGKISSIATFFGAKNTVQFALILYLAASFALTTKGMFGLIAGIILLVYPLNILPYISVTDKNSFQANKAWRRFIWLNYLVGFLITILIIIGSII